jgi:peptidyl-prolyl cis-trans isomerase SurA
MRRAFALLIAASALAGRAEVVDRIAVSVAGQVVTLSDVRRQIRISAFLEKAEPDYSKANLRRAAALLVDQVLIRREAELSRYPAAPNQEIESALDQFAESLGMDKPAMFAAALEFGFSEQEMREQAAWRLTLLHFVDYRFRPGVQVGEADVANYYNNVFLPQFRKLSPEATPPASDAVRGRIIGILNTQLATEASQIWLDQTRKQTRIRYFEEAF